MTTLEAQLAPVLSRTTAPRGTLRSASAVIGGLLATVVTTTAVDLVFHQTGVFPEGPLPMADSLFALALLYRIPLNVGGCYVAGRLAPASPRRHAFALGVVGCVLATLGAIAMWDCGPAWYSLANIAVALPCSWLAASFFGKTEAK